MATEKLNQKLCRIPPDKDVEFRKSVPAAGSIYFRPSTSSLIVGDGETTGGQEFVSRSWVLQKIEEANWKAISEQEAFKVDASAYNAGMLARSANSAVSPSVFVGFSVVTSATVVSKG